MKRNRGLSDQIKRFVRTTIASILVFTVIITRVFVMFY